MKPTKLQLILLTNKNVNIANAIICLSNKN